MVEWLFLAESRGCLRCVFVVFPDHTQLLFFTVSISSSESNHTPLKMKSYSIAESPTGQDYSQVSVIGMHDL